MGFSFWISRANFVNEGYRFPSARAPALQTVREISVRPQANALRMRVVALTLTHSVNEPAPRSDPKFCPLCGAKIAFSLALHMVAAHSPNSKVRNAESGEQSSPHDQFRPHQQSRSRRQSGTKSQNQARQRRSGFKRKHGKPRR
jgi:hypothetical protein